MRFFRSLVALVTLTAVAVQPALAVLHPCCCAKKVDVERPCCAAKHAAREQATALCDAPGPTIHAPARACCAKHAPAAAVIQAAGCCCLKAPPAVPAPRDQAKQVSEQQPSKQPPLVPVPAIVDPFDSAATALGVLSSSELRPLSGPPLLALYCIWRK